MKKITLNNLAALVQGREMTLYQRSLAVQEFDSVVNYLREIEEAEKANVVSTSNEQALHKHFVTNSALEIKPIDTKLSPAIEQYLTEMKKAQEELAYKYLRIPIFE